MDEEAIFAAALQHASPEGRAKYLDEACAGRPDLRRGVELLLRAHQHAGQFLQGFAGGPPTSTPRKAEGPGAVIGPYRLVREIGAGGMGAVWLAEQQQPVQRQVAVKLIRPGLTTAQVVARFEAERQALALMDHPNIARVLDAGTTDSGRPYFVMELIHGVPITRYCDEARLGVRERLELFIPVCQAVQHAHQKGIVHRDLKPSNVLIAPYDGVPVVKVIDFGIAKATGGRLTEWTLTTEFGAIVGTLEYMSPEQAELNNLDIDTRSDVYSLGVLLYELLTGTTPLERQRLRDAPLLELLRAIREEEPPRPSTRLSGTADLPAVAASRGLEPRRLSGLVRGELDWIVMRCLEKDRTRRYETASAVAADLHRYLLDEPVLACPPSAVYRIGKAIRRNKRALATLLALLLMLVVTLAGLAVSYVQVKDEQRQTQQALAGERQALYDHRVALAESYWDRGQTTLAERLLDECPAGLRRWEWHYLKRRCRTGLRTLTVGGFPTCVDWSRDGQLLAAGVWGAADFHGSRPPPEAGEQVPTQEGAVLLWDARSGRPLHTLPGHAGGVHAVAFDPHGRTLASAGADAAVRLWDPNTGRQLRELRGHTGAVWGVTFSRDGRRLASGGADKLVRLWDAATGREAARLAGHGQLITAVAFCPRGRLVASAGKDQTVRLWDARDGRATRALRGPGAFVLCVAFSPDGRWVAAGGSDRAVRVWDAETGQELTALRGHTHWVNAVAFSGDGRRLASAGSDQTVKIWDLATGQELTTLRGHSRLVQHVAFSPDGRLIASCGASGTVKVWDVTATQEARTLRGHRAVVNSSGVPTAAVYQAAFRPDGKQIASAGYDRTVRVWEVATGRAVRTIGENARWGTLAVAYSPDGRLLASGNGDKTARLWDARTGEPIRTLAGHTRSVRSVAFSPDGKRLASASHDGTVKLWDVDSGREVLTLRGHRMEVYEVAYSPDGRRLASASWDGTVKVWDATTGRELLSPAGQPSRFYSVAFSPDGRRLAGASGHAVTIWDADTGREVAALRGHTAQVWRVRYSPDGRHVATASADTTVKLWDAARDREVLTLRGHTDQVWGVAFSPDGWRLVSTSLDGTVKIWDATPLDGG